MNKRSRILLIVVSCVLVLGGGAWLAWPHVRVYFGDPVDTVTRWLPDCDRVEVFYLGTTTASGDTAGFPVRPYKSQVRILDHRTLTGADAESLASLWRSQTFGWKYQAMCHDPVFGFRFYQGPSLLLETTVCFECSNFYFTDHGKSSWWGFDSKAPQARALLGRLQQMFPESAPEAKPSDT